jgi:hypothetical protein
VALRVKRACDELEESDGERILVDRIWPRGSRRTTAKARDVSEPNRLDALDEPGLILIASTVPHLLLRSYL